MADYTYIHIPFCKKKCNYCAFTSFVNLNCIDEYIDALLFQISLNEKNNSVKKTLYIGGGTPSLLSISQLEKIINKFNFDKNSEITIELNPDSVDKIYLKDLYLLGFNRLSFGVQSFDDKVLAKIGRLHNSMTSIRNYFYARDIGFCNISIDLMYGIQTLNSWIKTLKIAKELDVDHISTYCLKVEDGTYFKKYFPNGFVDDDVQAKMYKMAVSSLDDFYHYEFSNFAKNKNFVSCHNLNYWNLNPYDGYGISACGFDGEVRYKNTSNYRSYIKNPDKKDELIKTDNNSLLEEAIFLGFRKTDGINVFDLNKKFNIDFNEKYKKILKRYLELNMMEKTKLGYKLTIDGILISNYILSDFLC